MNSLVFINALHLFSEDHSMAKLLIFGGIGIGAFVIYEIATGRAKQRVEERKEQMQQIIAQERAQEENRCINLYNKCVDLGFSSFEKDSLKIFNTVAESMGYADKEKAREDFLRGKELTKKNKKEKAESIKREQQVKKEQGLQQDLKKSRELSKYYDLVGKEKTYKMYLDLLNNAKRKLIGLKKEQAETSRMARSLSSSLTEREVDWAVRGGIASGIAGPAAGVATALDAQSKNAEIRKRNAETNYSIAQMEVAIKSDIDANIAYWSKMVNEYTEKVNKASTLIVTDKTEEDIFKDIKVLTKKKEITDSGSVSIVVSIKPKNKSTLFDSDVPACYDGSILASVIRNNRSCGKTYLVLPIEGLEKDCQVKGIITGSFKKGDEKDIKIEYKPYHLWEREVI